MIQRTCLREPDSIVLTQIAAAAGAAGHSVALGFRDFVPSALGLIWSSLAKQYTAENVRHVFSAKDAPQSTEEYKSLRLILVHDPRVVNPICWNLAVRSQLVGDADGPAPTILFRCDSGSPPDQPLPTLVLDAHQEEIADLQSWHLQRTLNEWERHDLDRPVGGVTVDRRLRGALFTEAASWSVDKTRLQEMLVVEALLVGSRVLRLAAGVSDSAHDHSAQLDDYERVHGLLDRLVGKTPDDLVETVAVAMVRRANVYLEAMQWQSQASCSRETLSEFSYDTDQITRRELTDLGNVRSREVRSVIEYIQRLSHPQRSQQLDRIGLVRELPEGWAWPESDALQAIRPYLRTWTPKQVISHFH